MADITLKVSPDELKTKAQEISGKIRKLENDWKQLSTTVTRTKGYWVGDASNAHQKQFVTYKDDMEKLIRRLKEHPEDLLSMAGVYEKAEKDNMAVSNQLPGDIIV